MFKVHICIIDFRAQLSWVVVVAILQKKHYVYQVHECVIPELSWEHDLHMHTAMFMVQIQLLIIIIIIVRWILVEA